MCCHDYQPRFSLSRIQRKCGMFRKWGMNQNQQAVRCYFVIFFRELKFFQGKSSIFIFQNHQGLHKSWHLLLCARMDWIKLLQTSSYHHDNRSVVSVQEYKVYHTSKLHGECHHGEGAGGGAPGGWGHPEGRPGAGRVCG